MSKARSFRRGAGAYCRGKPKSSGRTFLIVTEGEKTEPNYMLALRDRLKLAQADVKIIHPEATDPVRLTQTAIEYRDQRKRDAKKSEFLVEYDEVWVLFDLEDAASQRQAQAYAAMSLKGAAGICFAYSNPSFEFWLLLHEEYTCAQFANSGAVEKRFKQQYCRGYRKGWKPPAEFIEKLPAAVVNAGRCREYHERSGGDGNPSTQVDVLARCLNEAARPHLRLLLPGEASACPNRYTPPHKG